MKDRNASPVKADSESATDARSSAAPPPSLTVVRVAVPIEQLKAMARAMFGSFVKAVVDIERKVMVLGGELHSDEEARLIEDGSKQENLWGINVYPDADRYRWIEFDSLINIRPWQGNRSRGVDDPATRTTIAEIVEELIAE